MFGSLPHSAVQRGPLYTLPPANSSIYNLRIFKFRVSTIYNLWNVGKPSGGKHIDSVRESRTRTECAMVPHTRTTGTRVVRAYRTSTVALPGTRVPAPQGDYRRPYLPLPSTRTRTRVCFVVYTQCVDDFVGAPPQFPQKDRVS